MGPAHVHLDQPWTVISREEHECVALDPEALELLGDVADEGVDLRQSVAEGAALRRVLVRAVAVLGIGREGRGAAARPSRETADRDLVR